MTHWQNSELPLPAMAQLFVQQFFLAPSAEQIASLSCQALLVAPEHRRVSLPQTEPAHCQACQAVAASLPSLWQELLSWMEPVLVYQAVLPTLVNLQQVLLQQQAKPTSCLSCLKLLVALPVLAQKLLSQAESTVLLVYQTIMPAPMNRLQAAALRAAGVPGGT